jgi:nitrogen fixation/metabolism regulation signal transduction histidine kinase
MGSFAKIAHSLRFQLPAVVVGVFVGMLFLLMLFFHEMGKILVKTRQLAQSAELSDLVVNWNSGLSASARERTKLMSLGNESYLRSFQVALNEVNDIYNAVMALGPDTMAQSTREIVALHVKHMDYMDLLDGFSKDQGARRQALAAAAAAAAEAAWVEPAPAPAPKARKGIKGSKAKKGNKPAKVARAAKPRAPRRPPKSAEPVKEIALDSMTNETFKTYEQELREGLFMVQESLRSERKDKLASQRNSVGRAKDRLIYSLLLLLAMVGYVAVILKWKILDPLRVLKEGAVEIGRGSLGHQVSVHSRNEMGELAQAFNRMSVQLEHKQNAELKVKRLEAIEQIVRSVNHEINNPLMIISGNAEYLLAILETQSEDVKSKLGSIVGESRRIFTVTQRLKEIKEPVTESYIGDQDQMIDILRSSQIRQRDY